MTPAEHTATILAAEGPPVRSDDVKGRNAGRWIPRYRVHLERL